MYFSPETWQTEKVSEIIPVSSALSFDKVRGSLMATDDLFVVPAIGEEMKETAEVIAGKEEQQRTPLERKLLRQLQTATLNLAFFHDFQVLNLRITDQGFQRQTTDKFTTAFKYQEDALKEGFRNKGLNALDRVIDLLEQNAELYPEYTRSPAYTDTRRRIVQRAREVDSCCYIHNSQIVFRRLLPILKELEDTGLPLILGAELTERLREAIAENRTADHVGSTTFEELRLRCVEYLSFKACAQLIRLTGSLTDRGLYFVTFSPATEDNEIRKPATREEAAGQAVNMERSAERYSALLTSFIEYHIPELFTGHNADVLRRDNTDKRTFWA